MSTTRPRRLRRLIVTCILACITLVIAYVEWQPPGVQMCRAVDGDTLHCGEQRIRIVGLDAPELRGRCHEEKRLAEAATERLGVLIANGVTLSPSGRDRYDRVLAVVKDSEGQDVARVLVREGLARAYHGRGQRADWCPS